MTHTIHTTPNGHTSARSGGRPRLLTEVKKAEIAAMISVGCSRSTACRYVGCVPETLRNELRRDGKFREKIVQAERRRQLVPLQQIQQAGTRSWRAAAWLLERINPDEFSRRDPEVVTREDMETYLKGVLDVVWEETSGEERKRIVARLKADRIGDLREQIEKLVGDDPALTDESDEPLANLTEENPDEAVGGIDDVDMSYL